MAADADPLDQSLVALTLEALEAGRRDGVVTDLDEGTAGVLLRMAERMDDPDFPYIEGRFDNVTEGLYLKAARELGLTVAGRKDLPERAEKKAGRLEVLRAEQSRRTGS